MNLETAITSIYQNDGDKRLTVTVNDTARDVNIEKTTLHLNRYDGNGIIPVATLHYDKHRHAPVITPEEPLRRTTHGTNTYKAQATTKQLQPKKTYPTFTAGNIYNALKHSPEQLSDGLIHLTPDNPSAFTATITSKPATIINDLLNNDIYMSTHPARTHYRNGRPRGHDIPL